MSAITLTPPIHSTHGDDSPRVRRSDPTTSHEAADLNNVDKPIGWVLDTLARGPLADHDLVLLAQACGVPFTPQRLRTARQALVIHGLVKDSGTTTTTQYGRKAIIWEFDEQEEESNV